MQKGCELDYTKRLEKLEQADAARRLALRVEVEIHDRIALGLIRCEAALDADTYRRVRAVLMDYLRELSPWLSERA